MINKNKQKGVALLTALFIMAIAAIAAIAMSVRLQIGIRRTELSLTANKLYLIAQGVPDWAKGVLTDDYIKNSKNKKVLLDAMPQQFPPKKYDNALVSGKLLDEQALFNLNNLTNPKDIPSFVLLLQATNPKLSGNKAKTIATNLANWFKKIPAGSANPATDAYYLKQKPPYRAAHMPMTSISELRLVEGITSEIYQKLSPYITALPQITKININTAPWPVLMTLGASVTVAQAKQIIAARNSAKGFKSLAQLSENQNLAKLKIPSSDITVASEYFMVKAYAKENNQTLVLNSLLHRIMQNNKVIITTLWQSRGTL